MKRFTLCLVAVLILFSTGITGLASSMPYVGNKSTKVYHISECTHAGKISTKNEIYFSSRSEAEAKGYRRCYYCGDGVVKPGHGGGGGSGSGSNSEGRSEPSASQQVGTNEDDGEFDVWSVIACCLYAGFYLYLFFYESFACKKKSSRTKRR